MYFTSKGNDEDEGDESSAELEDDEANDGDGDDGSSIVPEGSKEGTAGKLLHPDGFVAELVGWAIGALVGLQPSITCDHREGTNSLVLKFLLFGLIFSLFFFFLSREFSSLLFLLGLIFN